MARPSKKNSLSRTDYEKWMSDIQKYCMPYILLFAGTFLLTLQQQGISKAAFYAAFGAALKAVIDAGVNLYLKYRAGN